VVGRVATGVGWAERMRVCWVVVKVCGVGLYSLSSSVVMKD